MIDITKVDLVEFIQKVYELSEPKGLAFSQKEAEQLIYNDNANETIRLDYVRGRACKMTIFKRLGGKRLIEDFWYDHTDKQFSELLAHFGIERVNKKEHSPDCECNDCKDKCFEIKLKSIKKDKHWEEIKRRRNAITTVKKIFDEFKNQWNDETKLKLLEQFIDTQDGKVRFDLWKYLDDIVEKESR